MEVERDIAGIALPFAAGVATAIFTRGFSCISAHVSAVPACLTMLSSAIFLMHPCHKTYPSGILRLAIAFCLASCGILCGISSEVLSIGRMHHITDPFSTLGYAMGERIESLGYASSDTNAIIKALIIGDRSDIPGNITGAFRKSGASHILALSGLHLGIIYGILRKALSIFGNSSILRMIRPCITIAACGLYVLATGAGASIVRAFLFIVIGEAARASGRIHKTGSVLLASLLIHLIIAPQSIRDAGFHLSYAAMAGIAFIFPWLRGFWPERSDQESESAGRKYPEPIRWIWNTASLSISCQITTGPIAYIYFGTFPVHFLLTNLIAIPLAGLIIPSALAATFLSSLGICPEILLRASEMLVTALSKALEVIASM